MQVVLLPEVLEYFDNLVVRLYKNIANNHTIAQYL